MFYGSSDERVNCTKISIIIVDVCTDVLRYLLNDIFTNVDSYRKYLHAKHFTAPANSQRQRSPSSDSRHASSQPKLYSTVTAQSQPFQSCPNLIGEFKYKSLKEILEQNVNIFNGKEETNNFFKCDESQLKILYPNGQSAENLDQFDISLCVLLLRFLLFWPCELNFSQPEDKDESIQSDIKRLLMVRNDYYAHMAKFKCNSFELTRLEKMRGKPFADYSILAKIECIIQRLIKDKQTLKRFMMEIDKILGEVYSKLEHGEAVDSIKRDMSYEFNKERCEYSKTVIDVLSNFITDINGSLNGLKNETFTVMSKQINSIALTQEQVKSELEIINRHDIAEINKKIGILESKSTNISMSLLLQIAQIVFLGVVCVLLFNLSSNNKIFDIRSGVSNDSASPYSLNFNNSEDSNGLNSNFVQKFLNLD